MTDPIDLDEYRPHAAGPVICIRCEYPWVSVRQVGTINLECPQCGSHRGASLIEMLDKPEMFLPEDCCGQVDSTGTCAAPACIYGEALKLIHCIAVAYRMEHPEVCND